MLASLLRPRHAADELEKLMCLVPGNDGSSLVVERDSRVIAVVQ